MASSAYGDAYTAGTVSTDAESPIDPRLIIGVGTEWTQVAYAGDFFSALGLNVPIAQIVDDEHLLLDYDWPGAALDESAYSIRFMSGRRYAPMKFSSELIDLKSKLRLFETAVPLFSIVEFGVNSPPVAVVDDTYVVGTAPTGAFSGHNNQIARKTETGWLFYTPEHGWAVVDEEENFVRTWEGTVWSGAVGLGASVRFVGAWNNIDQFDPGEVVTHLDRTWIAMVQNTDSEPGFDSDDWDLFLDVGEDGGAFTLRYTFGGVSGSAPSDGVVNLNISQAGATVLRVADLDVHGNDRSALISSIGSASTSTIKGRVRLTTKGDPTREWSTNVSAVTDQSGWTQLSLSGVPAQSLAALQDGADILLTFGPKGDKGDTGNTGGTGPRGFPGGPIAIPYTVDANAVTDADPGAGVLRFSAVPQASSATLRVDVQSALGASVSAQLGSLATASTSAVKAAGRVFATNDPSKEIIFDITGIAAPTDGYRNISILVTGQSATSPFAHSEAVTLAWVPKGDKGDAGTLAINSVTTGEPGTAASVTNIGSPQAAVLNIQIPRGNRGDNFQPTYTEDEIGDRAQYDVGPVFNSNGSRLSVLILSDSTAGDEQTLYFLRSAAVGPTPAVWDGPFEFGVVSDSAANIGYDGSGAGLASDNVQAAIDEVADLSRSIQDPGIGLILGEGADSTSLPPGPIFCTATYVNDGISYGYYSLTPVPGSVGVPTTLAPGAEFEFVVPTTADTALVFVNVNGTVNGNVPVRQADGHGFISYHDLTKDSYAKIKYLSSGRFALTHGHNALSLIRHGSVLLTGGGFGSNPNINLSNFDGGGLILQSPLTGGFRMCRMGGAGITQNFFNGTAYIEGVANQSAASDTWYFVYVFNANGDNEFDWKFDLSATVDGISHIGHRIKSNDPSRTLAGLAYSMDGGFGFNGSGNNPHILVRSIFNPTLLQTQTGEITVAGVVSGDGWVDVEDATTSLVVDAITGLPAVYCNCSYSNSSAGAVGQLRLKRTGVSVDGTGAQTPVEVFTRTIERTCNTASGWEGMLATEGQALTSGFFEWTPQVRVLSGTGTFKLDLLTNGWQ